MLTPQASTVGNDYLFTGRQLDPETGLYYFIARYFDNTLGRFISRDPLGYRDGLSLYNGYFAPNALDPNGTLTWEVDRTACNLILTYNIQVNFVATAIRDTAAGKNVSVTNPAWTPARKAVFLYMLKVRILGTFSNSGFAIRPKMPWYMCALGFQCCPCPCASTGFHPVLRVGVFDGWVTGEDFEYEVLSNPANPNGAPVPWYQSRVDDIGGSYAFLDEDDINLTRLGQYPAAHEFGHSIGLEHPGADIPGVAGTRQQYTYAGIDKDGNQVDGTVDLMGQANGLRPFYFKKWKEYLDKYEGDCGPWTIR